MPRNLFANEPRNLFADENSLTNDMEKAANLERFKYLSGSDRTAFDTLRDLVGGALGGVAKLGQKSATIATGGRTPQLDIDEALAPIRSPHRSIGGDIVTGIGEYAPYGVAGGASIPGMLAAGAVHGAATTNPGESNLFGILPKGELGGAIEGALLNMLIPGGLKVIEKLRPSRLLRGQLSPEQLTKNLEVTEGTKTGLGDVIDSPFLKRQYENVLPKLPFNKAEQTMSETAKEIKNRGKNIFEEIGIDETDKKSALQEALKQASKEARQEKIQNYELLNKMSDESGIKIGRENFSKTAQDILQDIKLSPELEREFPSDLLKDIQNYSSNKIGNNLKLSNIFKGKLNDKANEFYSAGKMYEYNLTKSLKDALESDIDFAMENSNNPKIKEQYLKSQKEYREKFQPFEEPEIVKFTRQGGDSDLILSTFLKTGQNDRANLLNRLQTKLKPSEAHLPLQIYLSSAIEDGEVNPIKLRTLYNKLGKNQKNVLIKDENLRNKLEDYVNLVGKNTEPLTAMVNPKTGQRNLDVLSATGLSGLGLGIGGAPGALAGAILPIIGGRMATNALTSESLRDSLIKEMLKNRVRFTTPRKKLAGSALVQSITKQLQGND